MSGKEGVSVFIDENSLNDVKCKKNVKDKAKHLHRDKVIEGSKYWPPLRLSVFGGEGPVSCLNTGPLRPVGNPEFVIPALSEEGGGVV
jgi:hypothetical protein